MTTKTREGSDGGRRLEIDRHPIGANCGTIVIERAFPIAVVEIKSAAAKWSQPGDCPHVVAGEICAMETAMQLGIRRSTGYRRARLDRGVSKPSPGDGDGFG